LTVNQEVIEMRANTAILAFAAILIFSNPQHTRAQSNLPSAQKTATQDQVLRDLLSEVHQLRMTLQRMESSSYRLQVTLERFRLQQALIARLSDDLNKVRSQINDVKSEQLMLKVKKDEVESRVDKGLASDYEVAAVQTGLEDMNRREKNLSEREAQLSADLNTERAKLDDINHRLDALERESLQLSAADEPKPPPKQN